MQPPSGPVRKMDMALATAPGNTGAILSETKLYTRTALEWLGAASLSPLSHCLKDCYTSIAIVLKY